MGIKTVPIDHAEKYPAVILVHGFGATKRESKGMFDTLAKHLAKERSIVYQFDFSGRGESEGDYSEITLSKLKEDLEVILQFVQHQPAVDKTKIGIVGQSLGTATIVALQPKVQAAVMLGSVAHPKGLLIKLFGTGYNPAGISARKTSEGEVIKVKSAFWTDFEGYDLPTLIKNIHAPILFIHGSNDTIVPRSELEDYFQQANKPKEKVILEGADHGLNPKHEELSKVVIQWFKKFL